MTIDTLEYAKELEAAGVSKDQAEAHARALKKAVTGDVATKADIAALRAELAAMETRLIKYGLAQAVGIVAFMAALAYVAVRLVY